jgi:hypothetical protein
MQRMRNATRDPAQDSAAKRRRTHFAEVSFRGAPDRYQVTLITFAPIACASARGSTENTAEGVPAAAQTMS